MSLESFYGGKQGVSPVIRASFKYVNKKDPAYILKKESGNTPLDKEVMEECFADSTYTDVWYGELAIIDAENRSNPNHGCLYRRTLNRSNTNEKDTSHGEYIGTLAGPATGFPQTEIYNFSEVKNGIAPATNFSPENLYIYPDTNAEGGIVRKFFKSNEELTEAITSASPLIITPKSSDFISGKEEDNIKYYWVDVVNNTIEDSEEKTTLYLGFQIPYPVFEFQINSVDWTDPFKSEEIKKEGDTLFVEHPFYKNTKLSIPVGVRGSDVGNLRKVKVEKDEERDEYPYPIYKYSDFHFNNGLLDNDPVPINSTINGKYIWLYDFTTYGIFDNNIFSKKFSCYLGDVEEIEKVNITEEGQITVKYFNKEEVELLNEEYPIKYIKNIQYNQTNGNIIITYNIGPSQTFSWPGLVDLQIEQNTGKLKYVLNNSVGTSRDAGPIRAIVGAKVDSKTKELTFEQLNGTNNPDIIHFEPKVILKNIENIFVDDKGYLNIIYTTKDENDNPKTDQFLISKPTQGIAAELYKDRLEAIGILQNLYYSNDEDKTAFIAFNKIKNNQMNHIEIQLLLNDIFWGLEKKYFKSTDTNKFNQLVDHFLNINISGNDEREKIIYKINKDEENNIISIDFYPYKDGQIPYFNQIVDPKIKESNPENWAISILEMITSLQDKGKIIYCNNAGFYYDFNSGYWKYAGNWSNNSNLSHIKIKSYKDGESSFDVSTEISPSGFYFEQIDVGEKQTDLLFQNWGTV